MIDRIVQILRRIVPVLIGLQVVSIIVYGIVVMSNNFLMGLVVCIGGLLSVLISNGIRKQIEKHRSLIW